MQKWVGECAC
uniref:Uncharacterized protein n=1 Tax=Arundo donax TaxID=35708 RepID=A0A0A9B2D9_ARUDO